jgi:hypothetical protein
MINKFKRGTALLLNIIIFVFLLTGCVTRKNIPPSEMVKIPERKNIYYFHSGDSIWMVYPVPGENGIFSGIIVDNDHIKTNKLRQVHIYAGPPSAIKIGNQTLSCPMENIGKVERHKVNAGMIISSAGVVLLLFTLPVFL